MMQQDDLIVRSIKLDADGTPADKSLRPEAASPAGLAGAAPAGRIPSAKTRDLDAEREEARASTPPAQPATPPQPAAAPERKRARYIGTRPLSKTVPLEYPMEFDGQEYHKLTLRPIEGEQFAEYAALVSDDVTAMDALIALMAKIPIELARDLFLDDKLSILEKGLPFMPRRLREQLHLQEAEAAFGAFGISPAGTSSSSQGGPMAT